MKYMQYGYTNDGDRIPLGQIEIVEQYKCIKAFENSDYYFYYLGEVINDIEYNKLQQVEKVNFELFDTVEF